MTANIKHLDQPTVKLSLQQFNTSNLDMYYVLNVCIKLKKKT